MELHVNLKRFLKFEVRDRLVYYCVLVILCVVRPMPLKLTRFLCAIFAWFAWYFIPSIRKLILANLHIAFPGKSESECIKIGRKSLYHLAATSFEMFWLNGSIRRIKRYVTLLDKAKKTYDHVNAGGTGFIVVTPHFGSWEATGASYIPVYGGHASTCVAHPFRNRFIHHLVNSNRAKFGNKIIQTKGAAAGMYKALKKGQGVGTLVDQRTLEKHGGVWVKFFGLWCTVSRAPAILSIKAKVPLIMAYCLRTEKGYDYFAESLENPSDNEVELTQQLTTMTEHIIQKYPEQYLWFYKRFIDIPDFTEPQMIAQYPFYANKKKITKQ